MAPPASKVAGAEPPMQKSNVLGFAEPGLSWARQTKSIDIKKFILLKYIKYRLFIDL
jgi:hypothetical protein